MRDSAIMADSKSAARPTVIAAEIWMLRAAGAMAGEALVFAMRVGGDFTILADGARWGNDNYSLTDLPNGGIISEAI